MLPTRRTHRNAEFRRAEQRLSVEVKAVGALQQPAAGVVIVITTGNSAPNLNSCKKIRRCMHLDERPRADCDARWLELEKIARSGGCGRICTSRIRGSNVCQPLFCQTKRRLCRRTARALKLPQPLSRATPRLLWPPTRHRREW